MLVAAMVKSGVLLPLDKTIKETSIESNSIAETIGVNNWLIITIFVIAVAYIVYRELKKPRLKIPGLKPKKLA